MTAVPTEECSPEDYDSINEIRSSYFPNYIKAVKSSLKEENFIYTPHCLGFHPCQNWRTNFYKKALTYPVLKCKGTRIRCISKWEYEKFLDEGFSVEQLSWIPYGVDVEKFGSVSPSFGSRKIYSCGNLRSIKSVETQIDAVKHLKEDGLEVELRIIGGELEEGYRTRLESLASDLGVSDSVFFEGYLTHIEILELLDSCELFVHTSGFESQGVAIYEALAAGFIPVLSDRPAHNYNFDNKFLFKYKDSRSLAEKLKYWLEVEAESKENISSRMRSKAENYSKKLERKKLKENITEVNRS